MVFPTASSLNDKESALQYISDKLFEFLKLSNGKPLNLSEFMKTGVAPLFDNDPERSSITLFDASKFEGEKRFQDIFRLQCMIVHNSMDDEYFLANDQYENMFGHGFKLSIDGSNGQGNNNWISLKRYQVSQIPGQNRQIEEFLLVKSFDDSITFKINDCVEFYGFFVRDDEGCQYFHSLYSRTMMSKEYDLTETVKDPFDFTGIRSKLLSYLENVCLFDSLCAELVLLHLISRIRLRRPGLAESLNIGQLPLNIVLGKEGLSKNLQMSIYQAFSALLPKVVQLPLTVELLNGEKFSPVMDYEENRLERGALQLSPGTHLLIDESSLLPGQLSEKGLENLNCLQELIDHQTLQFKFSSFPVTIPMDIPVIVFSEAKSMFNMNFILPLEESLNELFQAKLKVLESSEEDLGSKYLSSFHCYLKLTNEIDPIWGDDMAKELEERFMEMRKQDQTSPESFSRILELYRLMLTSYGITDGFDGRVWNLTLELYRSWCMRLGEQRQTAQV